MIITTAIIKGGTGKTTTAAALAQAAAHSGASCLAVDLDPQSNLTIYLGADSARPGSYALLHGQPERGVIQATAQGIDIIAGSADLATEVIRPSSSKRLTRGIEPIRDDYNIIIIDTPPQMGDLTYNALMAADGLLIPMDADRGSLQGLYNIVDIAGQVQRVNRGLHIIGTVITRYDARPKLNRYMRDVIRDIGAELGAPLLMCIRQAVAVKESQAMQRSLYEYAPRCKAAADYMDLYRMIDKGV